MCIAKVDEFWFKHTQNTAQRIYLRPSYFNDRLILAILASALTNAKFYTR